MTEITRENYDPYAWQRRQGSIELGIPESEMADEPDEMADHSDEQGYE